LLFGVMLTKYIGKDKLSYILEWVFIIWTAGYPT
jgi:hypothetical protein